MAARALSAPPPDIHERTLTIVPVLPGSLFRLSRHESGEPHFGTQAANRFDAFDKSFGTCYLAFDLVTAIAESLLHDRMPHAGRYPVAVEELLQYRVHHFEGHPLRLANLTGVGLNLLGAHGELSGTSNYRLTQAWSMSLHSHPEQVDGFIYMSRLNNCEKAVVLFDRGAAANIKTTGFTALTEHSQYPTVSRTLRIIAT